MTDDFRLFADPAEGETALDPDVSLITAYLARELSPVQIAAVRERLASDAEFRAAVGPILDLWSLPAALSVAGPRFAPSNAMLSPLEIASGWRRHQEEERAEAVRARFDRLKPIGRVAAVAVLVLGSLVGLAQGVTYVARSSRVASLRAPNSDQSNGRTSDRTRPALPQGVEIGDGSSVALRTLRGRISTPTQDSRGTSGDGSSVQTQLPAIRQLGPIEARFANLFTANRYASPSIRQLSDGTVLVSDRVARSVALYDATLAHPRAILDSGSANPSSRYPVTSIRPFYLEGTVPPIFSEEHGLLIPSGGDTTLFIDYVSHAYVPIGPQGEVSRRIPSPSDLSPTIDPRGRVYLRDAGTIKPQPPPTDSLPILRIVAGAKPDSLTFVRVPVVLHPAGEALEANPLPVNDDWALLADGSMAVIRANDFHIDWFEPDGTHHSTARIPFDWVRLTAERKRALVDSLHAHYVANPITEIGIMVGGRPQRLNVPEIMPISFLPDSVPPFGGYTAIGDADMHLWIRVFTNGEYPRSMRLGSDNGVTDRLIRVPQGPGISLNPMTGPPVYYVIDKSGVVIDRVQLPVGWEIAAFGSGGKVYLRRNVSPTEYEIVRARFR